MATASEVKTCAHGPCNCVPPSGKKYCSQVCEDSKGMTALTCHCGHTGCKDQTL